MDPNPLKKVLLTNKLIIVKRTLGLAGKSLDDIDLGDFDDDVSLEAIESKLKQHRHSGLEPADTLDNWLKRLFKP